MGKKNKGQAVASLKGETGTPPAETSSAGDTTLNDPKSHESKSFLSLKKIYEANPNQGLRAAASISYVKWLLNKPELTWEEYCDVKIKAFTEYWTGKKTKPKGSRAPKVLSPEDYEKKMKELEAIETRAANLRASIELTKKQTGAVLVPAVTPAPVTEDAEEVTE